MRAARNWKPAEIRLLGKAPDRHVAQKLGLSTPTVFNKRKELDIPACGKQWHASELALFSRASDLFIAAKTHRSRAVVASKRKELNRNKPAKKVKPSPRVARKKPALKADVSPRGQRAKQSRAR